MSNAKIIHGRFYGTGKRKNAVARVFLSPGTGTVTVNGRTFEDYFPRDILRMIIEQPFGVIERNGQYDVRINVHGGGIAAQAQAVRHGISRALIGSEATLRPALKRLENCLGAPMAPASKADGYHKITPPLEPDLGPVSGGSRGSC